jgi:hypothetical protein
VAFTAGLHSVLQALPQKEQQLDALELTTETPDREQLDLWRRSNLQAIKALEQAIACLPASTLDEAALQALIAEGTLNSVVDELCEAEAIGDRIETPARLIRAPAGHRYERRHRPRSIRRPALWPFRGALAVPAGSVSGAVNRGRADLAPDHNAPCPETAAAP